MRTATKRVMMAAVLCLAVVAAGAPAAAGATATSAPVTSVAAAAAAAPYCGLTWGSATKSGGSLKTPELVRVVTQRANCWDRTVFEFDGPVNGYRVAYATNIYTDGEGLNFAPYIAGGAKLAVTLKAPAQTYSAVNGDHVVNVLRYRTLRDAVYGGSFEGYTQFGVGVRAKLPFRVFVAAGPGSHSRIIVDVAHLW